MGIVPPNSVITSFKSYLFLEQCSRRRAFHGSYPSGWRNPLCCQQPPHDRFDIVVTHEEDGNKDIVKRVIGMPGDTIRYENDKLYINDKERDGALPSRLHQTFQG